MSNPIPLRGGLTQITGESDWKARFLRAMRDAPTVRAACEAAGISRFTAYAHRKTDPVFAEAWDDAIEEAVDALEIALYERAKATDTTAAIFILKARRPHLYREITRTEITGADGGPVALAAIAADRDRLDRRYAEEVDAFGEIEGDSTVIPGDGGFPQLPEGQP